MALSLIASSASAAILASEDFSYPDGLLVPNGGWAYHSGNDDFMVASGEAVVEHGTPSGDVNLAITPTGGGDIYFAFDFSVDDLGAPYSGGTDYEYFAHFKTDGTAFCARMDVVAPSGAGDYSVGIASDESTADATWGADLTFGVDYHVVVRYNQDDNIAQLWLDTTSYDGTSILGEDRTDPGDAVTQFALRQSDSSENEIVRVDNVVVSDACEDVFASDCPTVANELRTWGGLKSLYR